MATTQDDGPSDDSPADTPELRRLLETLRAHPAPREKLERLVQAALDESEPGAPEAPARGEEKGE